MRRLPWRRSVKFSLYVAVSAFALASLTVPAQAQHMNMPGMTMPMPPKKAPPKKPAAKKKAPVEKTAGAKKPPLKQGRKASAKGKAMAVDHGSMPIPQPRPQALSGMTMPMDHSKMEHGTMATPSQAGSQGSMTMPMDHQQMDQGQPSQMNMSMGGHGGHEMAMTGALGRYPMERESSGTAWQPDTSEHMGLMQMSSGWTLMAHGVLNLVYDHQSGRRGD